MNYSVTYSLRTIDREEYRGLGTRQRTKATFSKLSAIQFSYKRYPRANLENVVRRSAECRLNVTRAFDWKRVVKRESCQKLNFKKIDKAFRLAHFSY